MTDDIHISVSSQEEAERLRGNFEEVVARVNGDLMSCSMQPNDPISVEASIAFAEQSIDRNLAFFAENAPLQALAPELKRKFRQSIEQQARIAMYARPASGTAAANPVDAKVNASAIQAPLQEVTVAEKRGRIRKLQKVPFSKNPIFIFLSVIGISVALYGIYNLVTDLRCNSGAICTDGLKSAPTRNAASTAPPIVSNTSGFFDYSEGNSNRDWKREISSCFLNDAGEDVTSLRFGPSPESLPLTVTEDKSGTLSYTLITPHGAVHGKNEGDCTIKLTVKPSGATTASGGQVLDGSAKIACMRTSQNVVAAAYFQHCSD